MSNPEPLSELIELLKQQQATSSNASLLSAKNVNALVIAAVIGAFAFLWTNATSQPAENAKQFSIVASQTAEIRTTVGELKSGFAEFKTTLNGVKTQSDTNAAEIEALKKNVQAISDRITQLERDTR